MVASPAQDVERMFAKLVALGALVVLLSVPAVQATPDVGCFFKPQTTPYFGPVEAVVGIVNRADACAVQAETLPGGPKAPVNDAPPRSRDASCLNFLQEPSPDPIAQPLTFPCRELPSPEPGPEPQQYHPRNDREIRGSPMPGIPKEPLVCKAGFECRSLQGISIQ